MDLWQAELIRAARESQASFESMECITEQAHAQAATAVLRAFQHDPATILYAEPRTPHRPVEKTHALPIFCCFTPVWALFY